MTSTLKGHHAADRRRQRDAQKRFRELQRQAKEEEKLSALAQARFEVECFENQLEVIQSVYKEQGEVWDWSSLATALPPARPANLKRHASQARRVAELQGVLEWQSKPDALTAAEAKDDEEFQQALDTYAREISDWQQLRDLAQRILKGDHKAYTEAVVEFGGLEEISELGSSIHLTVHNPQCIECRLKVNGHQAIPNEVKSLTAAGKLSVKPMAKVRFHELYQDYVCGCMLRVAREIFVLLPIDILIVTASTDICDSSTGRSDERAVLSAAFPRYEFARLNFDLLDPSDAVESFLHRGDFKASRKSGAFEPIVPLDVIDLPVAHSSERGYSDCFTAAKQLRGEIGAMILKLQSSNPKNPLL